MPETAISCPGTCTVTITHELSLPPLQLSAYEGAQIGLAIISVWAAGFAFRMIAKVIKSGDSSAESED